jgi:hypothetical protein
LLGRVTELYRSEPGTAQTDIVDRAHCVAALCRSQGILMEETDMTVDNRQPQTRRKLLLAVLGGAVAAVLVGSPDGAEAATPEEKREFRRQARERRKQKRLEPHERHERRKRRREKE